MKQNLKGVRFGDKRLALEALQVKVCGDGDDVAIEEAIPIEAENIVSIPS